jgi:hypothetical protein
MVNILPSAPTGAYLRLFQEADRFLRQAVRAVEEDDLAAFAQYTVQARLSGRLGAFLMRGEQENDRARLNLLA